MPAPPPLLTAARKHRSSAIVAVLEFYYPLVHRLAHGLCGESAAARRVIDHVLVRAPHALARWRDDSAADRWFYHYAVLESRRHAPPAEPGAADPLLEGEPADPAYAAFVRALRALPGQQREAVLLNHGEHLNPRYLAVAMDCSAEAAANHLRGATYQLQAIAGERAAALTERAARAYRRIAPPPDAARPIIRRRVARFLRPRRIRRAVVAIVLIVVLVVMWRWSATLLSIFWAHGRR